MLLIPNAAIAKELVSVNVILVSSGHSVAHILFLAIMQDAHLVMVQEKLIFGMFQTHRGEPTPQVRRLG